MCSRAATDGVPVYLGEFGQSTHSVDDTIQYDATASFLNNARAVPQGRVRLALRRGRELVGLRAGRRQLPARRVGDAGVRRPAL